MSSNNRASDLDYDAIRCLGIPLPEKLSLMGGWSAEHHPQFEAHYEELIERLTMSGAVDNALTTGTPLNPFLLPDSDGQLQSSKKLLAKGPLVVSFNRGHWCPYCELELHALEEINSQVVRRDASIISITPQRGSPSKKMKDKSELSFLVLCDLDNAYALGSGLMMSIGEPIIRAYKDFGLDLSKDQGNEGVFLPMPATYVVDPRGMIVADFVHPDFRKRMAPKDILAALDKLPG